MNGFQDEQYDTNRTAAKKFLNKCQDANVLILVESHTHVDDGHVLFSPREAYPISLVSL
jgi:hypothetical protein